FIARVFGTAPAAHTKHESAALCAGDVLRRLDRNEEACSLAVEHDSGDSELMAEKNRSLSHTQLTRLGRQVVSDGLVRLLKGPAGNKLEAVTEAGKPVVINAVDDSEIFLIDHDEHRRHFVDCRQAGNLFHQ